ncbi:ankyrin repeat domain-containing protein 16-like [Copidosoma floridanum]|uniref:ankyrin repeat domain-containing protein 16-like n=1 Tax=Copidosoma floridanum TaxID=29053 RepID=UPI0006C9AE2C|nr:ankyrin repeat domain-containing protein 16-like [Copidosoma floridanum]
MHKFLAACQNGHLDKIKRLAEEHDIKDWTIYRHKTTGDTALHLAARQGHLEVVHHLCENWPHLEKVVVDAANFDMKRPLHEAAQFARKRILRYLLHFGAEVDALKRADWTPLMLACTQGGSDALECVETLLDYGSNSRLRNKDGWTPLLLASRTGEPRIVQLLIDFSPECVDDRSNNKRSALHIAAFHAHRDVVDLLLKAMPELLEARDSAGCTPLLESVKSKDPGITRHLIEQGANVEALDNIGQNLVHVAASVGNVTVIRYALTKLGEHFRGATDRFGVTPLQIAKKNKQIETARLLDFC